jgi:hypothetical protein
VPTRHRGGSSDGAQPVERLVGRVLDAAAGRHDALRLLTHKKASRRQACSVRSSSREGGRAASLPGAPFSSTRLRRAELDLDAAHEVSAHSLTANARVKQIDDRRPLAGRIRRSGHCEPQAAASSSPQAQRENPPPILADKARPWPRALASHPVHLTRIRPPLPTPRADDGGNALTHGVGGHFKPSRITDGSP